MAMVSVVDRLNESKYPIEAVGARGHAVLHGLECLLFESGTDSEPRAVHFGDCIPPLPTRISPCHENQLEAPAQIAIYTGRLVRTDLGRPIDPEPVRYVKRRR